MIIGGYGAADGRFARPAGPAPGRGPRVSVVPELEILPPAPLEAEGNDARVVDAADTAPARLDLRKILVLLLVLPLYGQFFSYMKDLPTMWALSKIWPVLTLPLGLILLRRPRPEAGRQLMATFLWLVLSSSVIGMFTFEQDFFLGLTSQVKLLPILSFFSFLGLLYWLRPSLREIGVAVLACAILNFVVLVWLWVVATPDWYTGQYEIGASPLFTADDRGNRIRLPMFFGVLGLFYCFRSFLLTRRILWLVAAGFGYWLIIDIVRMRAEVIAIAAIAAIAIVLVAGPWTRILAAAFAPLALVALFQIKYVSSILNTDAASGFDIRSTTAAKATAFMGLNPVHWLFGVGSISPLDPSGMVTYFNHFFFLADITWLGVVFEFGLFGAFLLALLPIRGMIVTYRLRQAIDTPLIHAYQDYFLYTLLISSLYPAMTLVPGEIATLMAIVVYIRSLVREAEGAVATNEPA